MGSFLTVVWDRMGTDEGFVFPRSRCPECDHDLRWYHNVPYLGGSSFGAAADDSAGRIPVKHLMVEAVFGLLFVGIGLATPWL